MRKFRSIVACVYGLALVASAQPGSALTVAGDFSGGDYGTSSMTLVNGGGAGAYWVSDPGISGIYGVNERLRLTGNTTSGSQRGNAWLNTTTVRADQSWTFDFTMQITYSNAGGAEGMGFHMHESGLGADTWIRGQGLGSNFLSVGFDTWNNGGDCPVDFGLVVYNNGAQSGSCVDLGPSLGNPEPWAIAVSMSFDGTSNLVVNATNTSSGQSTGNLNYAVNMTALNQAILGWSADTGGATENHDVVNFNGTFVPEPSTALLLGLGLSGLAWRRQRAH